MEPIMTTVNSNKEPKPVKKGNIFFRIFKAIFVHNIGYKFVALLGSALLWALAVVL